MVLYTFFRAPSCGCHTVKGTGCIQHFPLRRCSVSWRVWPHDNMDCCATQWVFRDTFCWCQYEVLKRVLQCTTLVVSYSFNFKSLGGHKFLWTDVSRPWSAASGVLCWGDPSADLSLGWGTVFYGLHSFTENSSHMDCIWTILLHSLMISCGNWHFIDFSHFKRWQTWFAVILLSLVGLKAQVSLISSCIRSISDTYYVCIIM
jgi:hypothetical protein